MKNKSATTADLTDDKHDHDVDLQNDEFDGDDEAEDDLNQEEDFDEESSEMLFVLESIYESVADMLTEDVHPFMVQSSLLTNWMQTVIMNCDKDEDFFLKQIEKIPELLPVLIQQIQTIEAELPDAVDEPMDAEAKGHFIEMKKMINDLSARDLSESDSDQQTQLVEKRTAELFEAFDKANAHPLDVEAAFLYYWVHFVAMEHDFSEAKFEKLTYYWSDVFEKMAIFIRSSMGIDDAF
jgi:hypothetical protein